MLLNGILQQMETNLLVGKERKSYIRNLVFVFFLLPWKKFLHVRLLVFNCKQNFQILFREWLVQIHIKLFFKLSVYLHSTDINSWNFWITSTLLWDIFTHLIFVCKWKSVTFFNKKPKQTHFEQRLVKN